MKISTQREQELIKLCNDLRIDLIEMLHDAQTGHPGGSLSVCEILAVLMFEKARLNPTFPNDPNRDRVILTKGHAAPMLYLILAYLGYFDKSEMKNFRQINSILQGHPCMLETPGVDLTSGPLGIGLPAAVGMACGLRLDNNNDATVYAIMGDGELDEGPVWEALMSASKFKTENLIMILDNNGVQLDGTVAEIMPLNNLKDKFKSFGTHVIEVDGHDIAALSDAIEDAKLVTGKPTMIIAHTIKGKGVSFMEGENTWHGSAINDEQYEQAIKELKGSV